MSRPDGRREARFPVGPLSPDPDELRAALAAEADLREQIARLVKVFDDAELPGTSLGIRHYERIADALLALPALQRLVAEAAEAAQLRKTLARVRSMRDVATAGTVTTAALDWALDGDGG